MARLLCCVLVVPALLLMSGCAGTFQPPRYKVPVVSYEHGRRSILLCNFQEVRE